MKKFLFLIIFSLLQGCGFEPVYINNNEFNTEFKKINLSGQIDINKMIISRLKLTENSANKDLNQIKISSTYQVSETSKNSQGMVQTYSTLVEVYISLFNDKNSLTEKKFTRNFAYNNKENKFDLTRYQQELKMVLINEIIRDIVLFLNTQ